MADLDDQLLEGGIDLSSEEQNNQINNENNISFDMLENGQSNNIDSQTSADSVCSSVFCYSVYLIYYFIPFVGLRSN